MNVSKKGIANLKGIQYFTALTTLRCGDNSITSDKFDISALTELDTLICSNNNLSSIDFSKNTKLKQLYCGSQKVTMSSIDVSMLEDLRFLSVIQTGLSSLDVSKNTKLTYLSCYRNPLTALDVSKNIELEELYVYRCAENGGGLTELDVRNNKKLKILMCHVKYLKAIDVSSLPDLENFQCHENQLTVLDLSNNSKLTMLVCRNNQLTELDLSKQTLLTDANCDYYDQVRNVTAQTFKITHENGDYDVYYYFRLDDNKGSVDESTLVETMTAGNYRQEESRFDWSRVLAWDSGGEVIVGSRRVTVPSGTVTPSDVYGNILLLNQYDVSGNTASGSVKYTYDVGKSTATAGAFTINWSAPADPETITGVGEVKGGSQVLSSTYHNLTGMQSDKPFSGVNIVVTRYSDGTVRTTKQLR